MRKIYGGLALLVLLGVISCGSGSSTTSTFGKANLITGTINIVRGSFPNTALTAPGATPYANAAVVLVNRVGVILDVVSVDSAGVFVIPDNETADYVMRIVDPQTREVVADTSFSLIDGDDVTINNVISFAQTQWEITFKANDTVDMRNQGQQEILRNIADTSSATAEGVVGMRASGRGWGDIAFELDVTPVSLGLVFADGFVITKTTATTTDNVGAPTP